MIATSCLARVFRACMACVFLLVSLAASAGGALEVGLLPNVSARILLAQYEPMQNFLTRSLGSPSNFSSAPDWKTFYQRAGHREYDMIVAASHVARLAQVDLGYRPLAVFQPKIQALFVVAKGAEGDEAALLKGGSLALANPASLVAMEGLRWLDKQGLKAGEQFSTVKVRGDDSVGAAILRGEARAGLMSQGEFRVHPQEIREQLKVQSVIAELPGFLVMVAPGMPRSLEKRLRDALLGAFPSSEEGRLFFERTGFKGMIPVDDKELSPLDAFLGPTRQALN